MSCSLQVLGYDANLKKMKVGLHCPCDEGKVTIFADGQKVGTYYCKPNMLISLAGVAKNAKLTAQLSGEAQEKLSYSKPIVSPGSYEVSVAVGCDDTTRDGEFLQIVEPDPGFVPNPAYNPLILPSPQNPEFIPSGARGILARVRGFPPVEGTRVVTDAGADLACPPGGVGVTALILPRTLRSGFNSETLATQALREGTGTDIAFTMAQCRLEGSVDEEGNPIIVDGGRINTVDRREIGNIGARVVGEPLVPGNELTRQSTMVGRVWRVVADALSPTGYSNQYLQYDCDGNKVFAPTTTFPEQAFQWTSDSCGNFGIMEDAPQHRLQLGESPCDNGKAFGADLGNYVIIKTKKSVCKKQQEVRLTTDGKNLYVNGFLVLTSRNCRGKHAAREYLDDEDEDV